MRRTRSRTRNGSAKRKQLPVVLRCFNCNRLCRHFGPARKVRSFLPRSTKPGRRVRLSVKKGVGCPILPTFTEDGAPRELRGKAPVVLRCNGQPEGRPLQ